MSFPKIDETHEIALSSWVEEAGGHPNFPIQNLPYGIFSPASGEARVGTAIANQILDMRGAAAAGLLPDGSVQALGEDRLNALMALPAWERAELRRAISKLLSDPAHEETLRPLLHAQSECTLHLPASVGDYTDFYVGIQHATNVGRLFRPGNPLLPNYKHVPIAYHGRASSIRPSGVPVRRPSGQRKVPDVDRPTFGPSSQLDYELELGVWIGAGNALGQPIEIHDAASHIAGFCLLNDWSARDFQAWEYVPLGPFLSKNFHSTISPWVISAEAMAPFRVPQPQRPPGDPLPLPYLSDPMDQTEGGLLIVLEVLISSQTMRKAGLPAHRLSVGTTADMYWTVQQMVTHHASGGCNLSPGDLLGTGTLSTSSAEGRGSLIELTTGGKDPISLPSGETRTFLEDGDELLLKATARRDGYVSLGFGECRAVVIPAA